METVDEVKPILKELEETNISEVKNISLLPSLDTSYLVGRNLNFLSRVKLSSFSSKLIYDFLICNACARRNIDPLKPNALNMQIIISEMLDELGLDKSHAASMLNTFISDVDAGRMKFLLSIEGEDKTIDLINMISIPETKIGQYQKMVVSFSNLAYLDLSNGYFETDFLVRRSLRNTFTLSLYDIFAPWLFLIEKGEECNVEFTENRFRYEFCVDHENPAIRNFVFARRNYLTNEQLYKAVCDYAIDLRQQYITAMEQYQLRLDKYIDPDPDDNEYMDLKERYEFEKKNANNIYRLITDGNLKRQITKSIDIINLNTDIDITFKIIKTSYGKIYRFSASYSPSEILKNSKRQYHYDYKQIHTSGLVIDEASNQYVYNLKQVQEEASRLYAEKHMNDEKQNTVSSGIFEIETKINVDNVISDIINEFKDSFDDLTEEYIKDIIYASVQSFPDINDDQIIIVFKKAAAANKRKKEAGKDPIVNLKRYILSVVRKKDFSFKVLEKFEPVLDVPYIVEFFSKTATNLNVSPKDAEEICKAALKLDPKITNEELTNVIARVNITASSKQVVVDTAILNYIKYKNYRKPILSDANAINTYKFQKKDYNDFPQHTYDRKTAEKSFWNQVFEEYDKDENKK